jgi:uncharacterized Zn finger protein (UPF0148 family)
MKSLTGPVLGLAYNWSEPAPGDKKSTGCRYCPITQSLAQASTGRARHYDRSPKSKEQRAKSDEKDQNLKQNRKKSSKKGIKTGTKYYHNLLIIILFSFIESFIQKAFSVFNPPPG